MWLMFKLTLWLPVPPPFTNHGMSDVGLTGLTRCSLCRSSHCSTHRTFSSERTGQNSALRDTALKRVGWERKERTVRKRLQIRRPEHKTQETEWRRPPRQPVGSDCPRCRKQQGQTLGGRGRLIRREKALAGRAPRPRVGLRL